MKYFALAELLRAIICSSILGFFLGCIYNSLSTLVSAISRIITVGLSVIRSHSIRDDVSGNLHKNKVTTAIQKNIYDFLFFTICGLLYLIVCYLTLDGVHRFFVLALTVASFIISKNTFGALFEKTISVIFNIIYRALFLIIYVLTYPARILARLVLKMLTRPAMRLFDWYIGIKESVHIRIKKKEIRNFFK